MNHNLKLIIVGPIILILVWVILAYSKIIDPLFLATPSETAQALADLFSSGILISDIIATLIRVFYSFAIATILGIFFGLLISISQKIYSMFEIVIDFFRSIPAVALFPLFMLFFGIGDSSKISVAVFIAFWIILLNTTYGVRHSSGIRRQTFQIFQANKLQIFREVILMDALPQIFIGLRVALSLIMVAIVATEMFIGSNNGLGYRIFDGYLTYRIPELYATLLVTGLIGYLLNKFFVFFERKTIHWTGK